jgi:glycerol dehydrogenase
MRLFGSPHRYYQGPGVFDDLGTILAPLGPHPLVVVDAFMLGTLGPRLEASLTKAGVRATIRSFGGEIT